MKEIIKSKPSHNDKKNKITTVDLFKRYPYKCYSKTNGREYIKYKDCNCDEKYGVTLSEYKEIIKVYTKYLLLYLRSGLDYHLPYNMGTFSLVKYKGGYYDYDDAKFYNNKYLFDYKFVLKWKKNFGKSRIKYKTLWNVKLSKYAWKFIFNWIEEKPSRIKNFNDK